MLHLYNYVILIPLYFCDWYITIYNARIHRKGPAKYMILLTIRKVSVICVNVTAAFLNGLIWNKYNDTLQQKHVTTYNTVGLQM